MIRSLYYTHKGELLTDLPPEQFSEALEDPQGLLWVDFKSEPPQICEPILRESFDFHPLAIADALEQSHVPKVDDWGEYLYLVLHAVRANGGSYEAIKTLELDIFLGRNYVVTHQTAPMAAIERVWEACNRDEYRLQKGAWHLLYEIADEVMADYMPVVEEIDAAIDQVEDEVFNHPPQDLLERIFTLKRGLLNLRRIIAPQREVLDKLSRGDYAVLPNEYGIFFRDIYDHLVRLYDVTDSLRDLVSGALDTYLSVVNNRMNEVMKTLTVITTMFMPLSFLAGFFGMNFFKPTYPLDAWSGRTAFLLLLAAMVIMPVGMYIWMRRRAWM